jgi:hypothetical protein
MIGCIATPNQGVMTQEYTVKSLPDRHIEVARKSSLARGQMSRKIQRLRVTELKPYPSPKRSVLLGQ